MYAIKRTFLISTLLLLAAPLIHAQGFGLFPGGSGGLTLATFASPPSSPPTNSPYFFTDASASGACTGGGSAYSVCAWNGSAWQASAGTSTGLGDPGANGVVYRSGSGSSVVATATQMSGPNFCSDAGSTDTYACNLSPVIASYVTGTLYWFKANTANTGAASINFNAKGALTIKKIIGAITTDLATGDIAVGQWVAVFYDGTNAQMASQLGTAVDTTSTQTITGKTVDGVTPTVFGYVDLTSSAQTQLNATEKTANKDAASGYAGLTAGSLLKTAEFPALTGDCTTVAGAVSVTCGAAIGRTGNPLSQFAATTSSQLAGVISDETGSAGGGVAVFSNGPTLTLTNATGLPISGITGLGTGVGTWLGTPSNTNFATALTGGALPRSIGGTNNTSGTIPQQFFGTTAPGSVAGNLPGDFFSDTTGHNDYWCNAASGTSAPACTSVTTGGWTLLNGGGGGGTGNAASNVSVSFSSTPTYTCPSASAGTVTDFTIAQLSANISSSTLASCTSGQAINFIYQQAAAGGPYTVVMPTGFSDACQVDYTPSAYTKMAYWWDGTKANLLSCKNYSSGVAPDLQGPELAVSSLTTPPSGTGACGIQDSTDHSGIECKNSSGSVFKMFLSGGDANPVTGLVTKLNGTAYGVIVAQKYFGTAAPGSVAGNLPGDLFSDTTNHNEYWCNAASGTAAPACTSVTTGGWTILNGGGGSGITALTGDATASGSGSVPITFATVNSNVGSYTNASITVNAKGLITAAASGASSSGVNVPQISGTVPGTSLAFGSGCTSGTPCPIQMQSSGFTNPYITFTSGGTLGVGGSIGSHSGTVKCYVDPSSQALLCSYGGGTLANTDITWSLATAVFDTGFTSTPPIGAAYCATITVTSGQFASFVNYPCANGEFIPTAGTNISLTSNGQNQTTINLSGVVGQTLGGTGVSNTASLTLGTSNQNWATLGTGIVKNTTTTGALSDAVSSDVITLWTGSCTSSTYLRGDGSCNTPAGSGNVSTAGSPLIHQVALFTGATTITGIVVGATDKPLVGVTSGDPAFSKLTLTNPATGSTFTLADGKTLTVNNTLTLSGTDSTTMTFPTTTATIARTDAGQTFTGTQTFSTAIAAGSGGTGVSNTATLTLGSTNQNWATLGTGIVKNTTTTGALSDAAAADVYGLWSGTCNSSTFLRGDGSCQTPSAGSVAWSAITNAAGSLTLANAGNATTFNQTSGVNWIWANTTSATSGTSQNSPILNFCGQSWHGGVTAQDCLTIQDQPGNGTDAAITFAVGHGGLSTGVVTTTFPGPIQAGSAGGAGGAVTLPEGTAASAASANDVCYGDSTLHGVKCSYNNGSFLDLPLLTGTLTAKGLAFNDATTTNYLDSSADFTITSHTLAGGASAVLDMSAASVTGGDKLPSAAGAAPTADGFIAFNTTTHALVTGSNGTTIVQAAAATGTNTSTTCTNQVVTVISSVAAPTCTTISSTYVNNTIALTGTDINTANQVTVTHLSAALPIAQGGTAGTDAADNGGIVYSNASQYKILAHTTTAGLALLSGNATLPAWSSGPPAQKYFGTAAPGSVTGNLPGDLFSDTTNHNEYWCNATSGTAAPACTSVTTGGWTLLNGSGGGGTVTSVATTGPITGGTFTTSGTIACATCVTSAASLTSTAIMAGGGSQASATPSATTTLDSSGNISTPGTISLGVGGSVGGYSAYAQGTATTAPTSSVGFMAPTSVTTKFMMTLPAAPITGLMLSTGTTDPTTITFVAPASNKVIGGVTPSAITITSSYVDNSIALTGTDINTSNQVTVTHLSAALPIAQGGTAGTDAADNGGIVYSNASQYKILAHTTTAGLALLSGNATLPAWSSGPPAQKYFGTAAPGSVTGNLPGDLFSDTTNHNEYWCNATSGTAAPACTSVTAGGWTLLNGSGGGGGAESSLTGSTAATTITETGTGFAITRAGVETANLTAPYVIQNTNSSNNNTSISLGISSPGTSTGQTTLNVNGAATGGDLADFGTGGTWTAGVLSGQTIKAKVTNAGAIASLGSTAGFVDYPQGSTSSGVAGCTNSNSICEQAPTTVSSYLVTKPGAGAQGTRIESGTSGAITESFSGDANHTVKATAQTASIGTSTLCAGTANTACGNVGQYRVSVNMWEAGTACSAVTAGSVALTITWTDEGGNAHSAVPFPLWDQSKVAWGTSLYFNTSLTTESAAGDLIISTNGSVIQYATTYTACTTGTGTYSLRATVEPLQ